MWCIEESHMNMERNYDTAYHIISKCRVVISRAFDSCHRHYYTTIFSPSSNNFRWQKRFLRLYFNNEHVAKLLLTYVLSLHLKLFGDFKNSRLNKISMCYVARTWHHENNHSKWAFCSWMRKKTPYRPLAAIDNEIKANKILTRSNMNSDTRILAVRCDDSRCEIKPCLFDVDDKKEENKIKPRKLENSVNGE